jgi:hypothetical protein
MIAEWWICTIESFKCQFFEFFVKRDRTLKISPLTFDKVIVKALANNTFNAKILFTWLQIILFKAQTILLFKTHILRNIYYFIFSEMLNC